MHEYYVFYVLNILNSADERSLFTVFLATLHISGYLELKDGAEARVLLIDFGGQRSAFSLDDQRTTGDRIYN